MNARIIAVITGVLLLLSASCLAAAPLHVPAQPAAAGASSFQVLFPRQGQDPAPVLVGLYENASTSLDIAIYSLTHPYIVKAIGDAQQRGIRVRVISDSDAAGSNVQKHAINDLLSLGVPVKINRHDGLMHLKMSIIDGKVATVGSYNYTLSASRDNDEVLVVMRDHAFVDKCRDEFNRMWGSPDFMDARPSY